MSVILDALRSQKKGSSPPKEPSSLPPYPKKTGGIFIRRSRFSLASWSRTTWMLFFLFLFLFIFAIARFGYFLLKNRKEDTPKNLMPISFVKHSTLDATLEKAKQLYDQNRLEESLHIYEDVIRRGKANFLVYNNLGMIHLKKESYGDAERYFQRAIEQKPNCASCLNNMGMLKTQTKAFKDAKHYLEQSIQLDPSYPDPYFNSAILHEKNGDIENAIFMYKRFLSVYPNSEDAIVKQVKMRLEELKWMEQ